MATPKKTPAAKPVAKPSASKAIANWDEELAKYAQQTAETEANTGSGFPTFSTAAGVLSLNDAPLPGNQMAVVILDTTFENVYYEGSYDAKNPQPPICFAQARKDVDLVPHDTVVERGQAQAEACEGCPMNEWGSADTGRGKACKNQRRLVVIPAGSFAKNGDFTPIEDPAHFAKAEAAFLKVPVTSVKGYAAYVKQIAITLRRPPFAVITRVSVVPDAKSQFLVQFEALEEIADPAMFQALLDRHEAAAAEPPPPYNLDEREAPPPRRDHRGAAGRGGKAAPATKRTPPVAAKKAAGRSKY